MKLARLIRGVLMVEYPKARWLIVLRNGLMLSVRSMYIVPLGWLVVIGYWWGLAQKPIIVALLATGITAYIVWGVARWQSDRLMVAMAQETGDPSIIAMYQDHGRRTDVSPWSSGTDLYQ